MTVTLHENEPDLRPLFLLRPEVVFLNHGSFGACPRVVLEAQQELRAYIEQNPMRFYHRELEERIAENVAVLLEGE